MSNSEMPRFCRLPLRSYSVEDAADTEVHKIVKIKARSREAVDYCGNGEINEFAGMVSKERIPYDRDHDPSRVIGYADKLTVTDYGLEMTGHIFADLPDGDIAYRILKHGVPQEASIAFFPIETEHVSAGEAAIVDGVEVRGPVDVHRKWELYSITLCGSGVDGSARTEPVNFARGKNMKKIARKLSDAENPEEFEESQEVKECENTIATEERLKKLEDSMEEVKDGFSRLLKMLEDQSKEPLEESLESEEPEKTEEKPEKTLSRLLSRIEKKIDKVYSLSTSNPVVLIGEESRKLSATERLCQMEKKCFAKVRK